MSFRRAALALALTLLVVLNVGGAPPGAGAASPAPFVPGELLMKFRADTTPDARMRLRAELGATTLREFASRAEHWLLPPGVSVEDALARLQASPAVAYAEPNYLLSADVLPNDPRFPELWGMYNTGQTGGTNDADIDADMAWGVSTGSPDVIVGVIDTGIDYNHPDLAANIWTNAAEAAGVAGVDDDANGYVDDVRGWDWVGNDNDPFDDNGHGTHCSGTITGIGDNGIGVAGVAWHVKLMPLKFLSAGGSGSTANAVLAVDYATMMGVDLTSNSWGGGGYSQTLYDAIARANAAEMAFVAAAGNNGTNNDTAPHYPSNYDLPNVISVAATDHTDAKASFSNYGAVTVDLGAPGDDILSTLPGNSYGLLSGTSMATPHVAGACALIRSVSPNIPVAQLKTVLLGAVDEIPSMQGRVVSNGRLNAFFAIAEPDDVAPGAVDDLAPGEPGSNTMGLTWTATGDDGEVGTVSYVQVRYSKDPITEGNFDAAARAGGEPAPLPAGTPQAMEVRGLDASSTYYFALVAFDEWGNRGPVSNVVEASTLPPPTGEVAPTAIVEALFTGESAAHVATLSNVGVGTLDFSIPPPDVGEPTVAAEALDLGKDDVDPRAGGPVTQDSGGPDAFGYRWVDSDDPGGPVFAWTDISTTGTAIGLTGDDATSGAIALGFDMPFYGTLFDSIRVCTNGWLSFTSSATAYSNQPLPGAGGPENLLAPFWDDLKAADTNRIFFESFGNKAIVQWNNVERYSGGGSYTFQAILDASGAITFQYLTLTGDVASSTVGIQDGTRTAGLQVAFNQTYLHDNLAVRFSAIPQWLSVTPTSGRLHAGQSLPLDIRIDASGLEGGTYPGSININTNDPQHPVLTVAVTLTVTGAPDISVQPASIAYGDRFVNNPHAAMLIVANDGTDVLHVTGILSSDATLTASPDVFDVPPHGSQTVTVTWSPVAIGPFAGTLTIASNDAADPSLDVPVTGNAVIAPIMLVDPPSFEETLYSGHTVTRPLLVQNTGGADLVVNASADQGDGVLVSVPGEGTDGAGGPDAFGYRFKDSNEPGGPAFDFVDIGSTGTQISFTSPDDSLSAAINMGLTFPFYGNTFSSLKVSTNGWLTFDTADTSSRLTNSNLPSSSGARNMIALFWDDLHLRAGNVRYQNMGDRFIVQYTNVEKFSPSGNPLTFQVQLFQNGQILLQYRTMAGTLNSATIGIQDQTRTIGLPANFNQNYIASGMAIRFGRVPDWLAVRPASATVPPGGSFTFDVTFDSNQRNGGDLSGAVVLRTNVPSQAEERLPAVLHVIGAPIAATVPTSFDYGQRFTGYPYLTTLQVVNNGTDVLNVSEVYSSDPSLVVEEPISGENLPAAGFSLPPGGARLFNLRWTPGVPMTLAAGVHVLSDDPVTPDYVMPVTGVAILPPVAVHSPSSFNENLDAGEVVHRVLRLENQGGSDLTFDTRVALDSGAAVTVYEELELKKDEEDPREGVLGSGGPDVYGYRFSDSDAPGGPVFDWVDISATGTPIAGLDGDDESSAAIPLGFTFPFYGNTFTEVRVKTNGFLSFTSTSTDLSNDPLPNTGAPENLLAVFWDDLHFRSQERARYLNDGSRFIVQFTGVDRFSSSTPSTLTFQVILYPSGRIVYQYLTMTSAELQSATVGIQNAAKTDGLTVVHNAPYMHDGLAVEFAPPFVWPRVTPASGTVPAGGALDLDVQLDTTGLVGGDYNSLIRMTTNDPANGLIDVPVNVHVTGIPDIEVTPASLAFPTTFVGFDSVLQLQVRNTGTETVHVSDAMAVGDFAIGGVTLPFEVAPGRVVPLTVHFVPTDEGTRTGVVTFYSDDPDEPEVAIPLTGEGLFPPEIHVTPAEIRTALPPGGRRDKTLRIANAGGSDLHWTGGTTLISAQGSADPGTYVELEKEEADGREGTLGSGGPDFFGYRWVDSDEPGGPLYEWVDISTIGTPLTQLSGDDQVVLGVPLGFAFPFYGQSFTTASICTNGWLSFTSNKTTFTNQPLPNNGSTVPENLLAVFWDDLHFRGGVHAYFHNDGQRFIVQWDRVERLTAGSLLTFQAQLYPNGRIVMLYQSMSGTLDAATIGIQNAQRDDGLTVVFNAAYVHDNLAVEYRTIPQWMTLDPTGGTVPEDGATDATLRLDAAGLEDGIHEGFVKIESNDPYTPFVDVPVRVNVSLIEPTSTEFVPKIIRHGDNILRVRMTIELPAGLDPHAIRLGSVTLNDEVPALADPAPYYTDADRDGIEEVTFWFDKALLEAVLPEAQLVPVTIMGEVEDVQWWRGTDYVRTGDPDQIRPVGGEYLTDGQVLPVRWTAAAQGTQHLYTVQLTRDGVTWETLATGLAGYEFDWTVSGPPTTGALIRVLSYDGAGVLLGEDVTDAAFTLAGGTLRTPRPIDGSALTVTWTGLTLDLAWKAPATDLDHGPAESYRVLRGSDPAALAEAGLVSDTRYSEDAAAATGRITYYRIVATNAAGDATP